jgi:hypothetical protein
MYDKVILNHMESVKNTCKENKNKILNIYFEELALHPSINIKKICKFLKTFETLDTPISSSKIRVPKKLFKFERAKKFANIEKMLDREFIDIIDMHSKQYEASRPVSKL